MNTPDIGVAKRLLDYFQNREIMGVDFGGIEHRTIISALALAAAVDESEDAVVLWHKKNAKRLDESCRFQEADEHRAAAALLVAQKAEIERVKALSSFDNEGICLSCGQCIEAHERRFKCP